MNSFTLRRYLVPVAACISIASLLLLSSGCMMVGPNYERPDAAEPDAWRQDTAAIVAHDRTSSQSAGGSGSR